MSKIVVCNSIATGRSHARFASRIDKALCGTRVLWPSNEDEEKLPLTAVECRRCQDALKRIQSQKEG